jgi:hypothetical protein
MTKIFVFRLPKAVDFIGNNYLLRRLFPGITLQSGSAKEQ